eukprot:4990838-Amphidinium_carterae.1
MRGRMLRWMRNSSWRIHRRAGLHVLSPAVALTNSERKSGAYRLPGRRSAVRRRHWPAWWRHWPAVW